MGETAAEGRLQKAWREYAEVIRGEDPERIAAVIDRHLWDLLAVDFAEVVARLAALPEETLARHGALRLVHVLCVMMTAPSIIAAEPPESAPRPSARPELELQFQRMLAHRMRGAASDAADIADGIRERLTRELSAVRAVHGSTANLYYLHLGITALVADESATALTDFTRAAQLSTFDAADLVRYDATAKLALTHALRGSDSLARRSLRAASAIAVPEGLRPFTQHSAETAAALLAVDALTPDAQQRVDDLDAIDPVNELWPLAVLARGRLELSEARYSTVLEECAVYSSAHAHGGQRGLSADVLTSLRLDALSSMREFAAAHSVLANASAPPGDLTDAARTRLSLREGNVRDAARNVRRVLNSRVASAGARDEAVVASAWVSYAADGLVDAATARYLLRLAIHGARRRLLGVLPDEVVRAVRAEAKPNEAAAFDAALAGMTFVSAIDDRPALTAREREVLSMIRTRTVAEAAAALFVSPNTVKTQVSSAYRKLGARNRDEALLLADRHGLLRVDPQPPKGHPNVAALHLPSVGSA